MGDGEDCENGADGAAAAPRNASNPRNETTGKPNPARYPLAEATPRGAGVEPVREPKSSFSRFIAAASAPELDQGLPIHTSPQKVALAADRWPSFPAGPRRCNAGPIAHVSGEVSRGVSYHQKCHAVSGIVQPKLGYSRLVSRIGNQRQVRLGGPDEQPRHRRSPPTR